MKSLKYNWVSVYNDNTRLPQFNEDGSENKYQDIDRGKLSSFEFYKDGKIILVCDIAPGARLIYRRRVEQSAGSEPLVVYILGWQKTLNGLNSQSIVCIPEYSNTMVFSDGWREGSRWLYPVVELECERVS